MKNTLAENMLRFGSKNLSEASKKKLQKLAEQEQGAAVEYQTNTGVKSMLAIPDVVAKETVILKDIDPKVKYFTINTIANKPTPPRVRLVAVNNDGNSVVGYFGGYNLVIGNVGVYNTLKGVLESPKLKFCFTLDARLFNETEIVPRDLKYEDTVAALFAKICLTAKDNNKKAASDLYIQQSKNLINIFRSCTLTVSAPIPVADPMKLEAFNKKVDNAILNS